jgi:hypothetical protein
MTCVAAGKKLELKHINSQIGPFFLLDGAYSNEK